MRILHDHSTDYISYLMNVFFLSHIPTKAAGMLCDSHVRKMALEAAQLLTNAEHYVTAMCSGGEDEYFKTIKKPGYYNNPYSNWAKESLANCEWLYNYGIAVINLHDGYYHSRHKTKHTLDNMMDSIYDHACCSGLKQFQDNEFTPPPVACATDVYELYRKLDTHYIHIMHEDIFLSHDIINDVNQNAIPLNNIILHRIYYSVFKSHLSSFMINRKPFWFDELRTMINQE